jgi:transcriptional regulator NrdR family protein
MVSVIKRDGKREKFKKGKIKKGILEAAKRADVSKDRANEVAERVAAKIENEARKVAEIRSSEIRDKVLSALEDEEASIADEFRNYKKA